MEKETSIVYVCPFCRANAWFDRKFDLEQHLYKDHLRETLNTLSDQCKEKVRKSHKKWFIEV